MLQRFCRTNKLFNYRSSLASFVVPFESIINWSAGWSFNSIVRKMSSPISTNGLPINMMLENSLHRQTELLTAVNDLHGGVTVDLKEPMDSKAFTSILKASLSHWRQQGKRGVWIKLPIELANLVEPAVQEGFRYHHAEPDYLMLVYWIPETANNSLPANASHRVGIGAFVMNNEREVLVVQERNGTFKDTGIWKLPTGTVDEGEDICAAAIREVKEETGIDAEFVEVLAFRQSHQAFFRKSDLFFVCMLRPRNFVIQKQDSEIEAAQWMPAEDYASQPYVLKHDLFNYVAQICLTKSEKQNDYAGFAPLSMTTGSGKMTYLYFNNRDFDSSNNHRESSAAAQQDIFNSNS